MARVRGGSGRNPSRLRAAVSICRARPALPGARSRPSPCSSRQLLQLDRVRSSFRDALRLRFEAQAEGGVRLRQLQRAFMSKQEEKVNILKRFEIFYLCNGRPVTGHSHAHTSGAWRRSFGRRNVRLRAGRCKDKKIQNVSEYSVFAMESLVLRRTLSIYRENA